MVLLLLHGNICSLVLNCLPFVSGIWLFYFSGFGGRPIGALLLGRLGDRWGRRIALVGVFVLLFLGDLLVALNTPAMILSPILIGLGLGGEWGSASVMMAENVTRMRGGWTSLIQLSVPIGLILSLGVVVTQRLLLIPSFISLLMVPLILSVPEPRRANLGSGMMGLKPLLKGIMVKAGESSNFYVFTSFSIPFLLEAGLRTGIAPILIMSVEETFLMIPMGIASDIMGRREVIRLGMLIMLVSSILLSLSAFTRNPDLTLTSFLLFGLGDSLSYAPQGAYLAELYHEKERVTMTGLAYQLSATIAGGISVLVTSLSLSVLGIGGSLFTVPVLSAVYVLISILAV